MLERIVRSRCHSFAASSLSTRRGWLWQRHSSASASTSTHASTSSRASPSNYSRASLHVIVGLLLAVAAQCVPRFLACPAFRTALCPGLASEHARYVWLHVQRVVIVGGGVNHDVGQHHTSGNEQGRVRGIVLCRGQQPPRASQLAIEVLHLSHKHAISDPDATTRGEYMYCTYSHPHQR